MEFADALARCAKDSGLNDVQIAAAVGTSQSAVSRWLSGDRKPRYEQYQKLIQLFPELPRMVALVEQAS